MVGFHRDLNRETAGNWDSFAPHRQRVTDLIAGIADATTTVANTVAILGAGNCNDLALEQIAARFAEVHLCDLDREALGRARDRQSPEVARRLTLHAPIDLGGALATLRPLRGRRATPDELGGLPRAATAQALAQLSRRFDAVASTCILSQLVHGCQRLLGEAHPQIQEIACAVALAHVRLTAELLRPGGTALIVTDTVSSATYPLEELWGHKPGTALIEELEDAGNHLSGTGPRFLRRILNTDPVVAPLVGGSQLVEPWLWRVAEDETYLVYALRFQRRA